MSTDLYQDWTGLPTTLVAYHPEHRVQPWLLFAAPCGKVQVEWSATGKMMTFLDRTLLTMDPWAPRPKTGADAIAQALARLQVAFPADAPARIEALAVVGRDMVPQDTRAKIRFCVGPDGQMSPVVRTSSKTFGPLPGSTWGAFLGGIHMGPMQPLMNVTTVVALAAPVASQHQRLSQVMQVRALFEAAGHPPPV